MKITQLSVFAENKPGYIIAPCRRLADAGVQIRALALAETLRFGVLRMIVSDPDAAATLLQEAGFVVKATEVLALEVPNRPGGLSEILAAVENTALNIEYMYALSLNGHNTVLIFQFTDLDAAIDRLQAAGVSMIVRRELQEK